MKTIILDDWEKAMINQPLIEELKSFSEVVSYHDHPTKVELIKRIKEADAIISIRERTKFDEEVLNEITNKQLIAQTGAGLAHINLDVAKKRGLKIATTPGGSKPAVTELTFAFMLGLARNIPSLSNSVQSGKWPNHVGANLHGKTLGIIGLGRIGSEVARVAKAFGMEIVAWGPTLDEQRASKSGAKFVALEELLSVSDFVSIHLRAISQTINLLQDNHFKMMKKTAYIINTSRGKIINEVDLIDALNKGEIAGAGLDVYVSEPIDPNSGLLKLENVILTPHIGWVTDQTFNSFLEKSIQNIKSHFIDGKSINLVEYK